MEYFRIGKGRLVHEARAETESQEMGGMAEQEILVGMCGHDEK